MSILPLHIVRPPPLSPYGSSYPMLALSAAPSSASLAVDALGAMATAAPAVPPPAAPAHPPVPLARRPSRQAAPRVEAWPPLGLAALAAGGKLLAAIGASATVQAIANRSSPDIAVGAVLLGVGLSCAVTAAVLFGRDAHRERPQDAKWLKAVSIGAALALAAGAALHQHAALVGSTGLIWAAFAISGLGFGAVSISLPLFFSYSEAQRGRSVARAQERALAIQVLGSGGLAILGAYAGVGGAGDMPRYVGSGVVTVAVTLLLLHMALTKSDAYRLSVAASAAPAVPAPGGRHPPANAEVGPFVDVPL